jgi:hypothetical protein
VKFLVLMSEEDHFARWDAMDDPARKEAFGRFENFAREVEARGTMLAGEALAEPAAARTLRPGDGRPVVAGPFAETVEQLGGFFLIDVPDLETAVALVRELPESFTVEVRPVIDVMVG